MDLSTTDEQTTTGRRYAPRHLDTGDTDTVLCERAREGDQEAVAELWRRHYPYALVVARRYTRSQWEADDLAAEAFTRILILFRRGQGPVEYARTYIARAVRNAATDRSRRKTLPTVEIDEAVDVPSAYDLGSHATSSVELDEAVEGMSGCSERQRYVLWQVAMAGRTVAELATELDTTPNAVSALLVRARATVRRTMDANREARRTAARLRGAEAAGL
ncbi:MULTISPECIES: RNA polymerase sigma factor [Cellulosimicrobium]|uniref:Sigma-70 family RNA polymerase sigma factor n=1 Tax=Cellulosimicrobium sp. ES-005 TaxID=3163031 RepID=A0AAU8FWS1_9MICO|nr:sigma-70 family RNA polymerase sigma factor [Cellulosimicrobium cellulans]MCO7275089.1 sigma-70 family RNA polymerase sigma factor [Cellulosimicrobium cellulans]